MLDIRYSDYVQRGQAIHDQPNHVVYLHPLDYVAVAFHDDPHRILDAAIEWLLDEAIQDLRRVERRMLCPTAGERAETRALLERLEG